MQKQTRFEVDLYLPLFLKTFLLHSMIFRIPVINHTAISNREVQGFTGNPCNENRDLAMRTGVPCNENRVFPVGIGLQGVPCTVNFYRTIIGGLWCKYQ